MKTGKELTAKQKLFVENYVSNGYKLQKAYMDAYNCSPENANPRSWELMKDERIKEYMRELQHERFEALGVNADRIAAELTKMAFAEIDENNTNQTKARALELLQKQMGLEKTVIKTEGVNIDIKIDETTNKS